MLCQTLYEYKASLEINKEKQNEKGHKASYIQFFLTAAPSISVCKQTAS